nr:sialin-like isoform X1 [Biomphalaria glabrata]
MGELIKAPMLFSQRFYMSLLAFIGLIMVYVTRVNISVAILCMIKNPVVNATLLNMSSWSNAENSSKRTACGEGRDSTGAGLSNKSELQTGEFDWDKLTRSELLSMYFYGYIITQIPSGWLASRYGGKRVWGVNMLVCGICSLVSPICARTHVYLLYFVRFVLGVAAGVTFPCLHALLGKWAPPLERTILTACTFSGIPIGNIVTFSISGVLCQSGFDNGWGSIFYLSGIFTVLWVIAWFLMTADTPAQHKWISERERVYIESSIGKGAVKKVRYVPWLKMFTSGPLWAVIVGHFCSNYLAYTLITSLPTFMKESLNFDIKQNGVLSSLPYVCQFVSTVSVGHAADLIRQRGWISTTNVRKSFQVISFLGITMFVSIVGLMSCEQRHIAVLFLCLCTVFNSLSRGGYVVNHLDLAPSYAGILFGITNTAGTIPGMIAPIIAGALTPNRTADEWRIVFYVCAAVAAFGAVVYFFLADGELQEWAVPPDVKIKMDILEPHMITKDKPPSLTTLLTPDKVNSVPETAKVSAQEIQQENEVDSEKLQEILKSDENIQIYRF